LWTYFLRDEPKASSFSGGLFCSALLFDVLGEGRFLNFAGVFGSENVLERVGFRSIDCGDAGTKGAAVFVSSSSLL
jgi:hypothetical protein